MTYANFWKDLKLFFFWRKKRQGVTLAVFLSKKKKVSNVSENWHKSSLMDYKHFLESENDFFFFFDFFWDTLQKKIKKSKKTFFVFKEVLRIHRRWLMPIFGKIWNFFFSEEKKRQGETLAVFFQKKKSFKFSENWHKSSLMDSKHFLANENGFFFLLIFFWDTLQNKI